VVVLQISATMSHHRLPNPNFFNTSSTYSHRMLSKDFAMPSLSNISFSSG
jgi:hypothetical protein